MCSRYNPLPGNEADSEEYGHGVAGLTLGKQSHYNMQLTLEPANNQSCCSVISLVFLASCLSWAISLQFGHAVGSKKLARKVSGLSVHQHCVIHRAGAFFPLY